MSHNYLNLAFHSSIVIILPSCITPLNIPSFDTFIRIFILLRRYPKSFIYVGVCSTYSATADFSI